MKSKSETGHYINVENFHKLITICTGLGASYNPNVPHLTLANLSAFYQNAKTQTEAVITQKNVTMLVIAERAKIAETLKKRATEAVNYLKVCAVPQRVKDEAMSLLRKLRGTTKRKKTEEDATEENTAPANTHSTSRQSFNALAESFLSLIDLLQTQATAYNPNIATLEINTLQSVYNDYLQYNHNAEQSKQDLLNARNQRNQLLYQAQQSLNTIIHDLKNYLKAIFGIQSSTYKQVTAIPFRFK